MKREPIEKGHAVERVLQKIDESRFFLRRMHEHDTLPEFGYYLSAFLSALNSVVELCAACSRHAAEQMMSDPDIAFLMTQRNVEVHRNGVDIVLRWDSIRVRPTHFEREAHRFRTPRWKRFKISEQANREWLFKNSSGVISQCTKCLDRVTDITRNLTATVYA
jgi:bacterioferritin-associated ferredoxin